ncbi:MAG: phage tail assembly chaperone [Proteobacteria bacterium]|nr:phage tail assembly chaperone [Pseudomonadota bacterium]
MYHVITRKSDGAVMDRRPETVGIMDVLNNQVIVNHGGAAADYEITTSETPVEVTDLRSPAEIEAAKWAAIRAERDRLLAASDEWGLVDRRTRATPETIAAWDAYRQALCELPQTSADPDTVVWPDPPAG